jgi:AAA domain
VATTAVPKTDEELAAYAAAYEFAPDDGPDDEEYFRTYDLGLERVARRAYRVKEADRRREEAARLWASRPEVMPGIVPDERLAEVIPIGRPRHAQPLPAGGIPYGQMSPLQREIVALDFPGQHAPGSLWNLSWGSATPCGQLAAEEVAPDILNLVDMADLMLNGVTRPEMLLEGLLVRAVPHRYLGPQDSGKTWVVLYAAAQLIARGETVIWVDKEMGRELTVERLVALGCAPEDVRRGLVYLEDPALDCSPASAEAWLQLLEERRPALVIVDAQMEVLADSGLNENMASDVLKWHSRYAAPALRLKAATLMIDHTGHDEGDRARGSSAKGQSSRIELSVSKVAAFDRERVGTLRVAVRKNAMAADIPAQQWFRIGGTPFELEPIEMPASAALDSKAAAAETTRQRIEASVLRVLSENPGGLSGKQVRDVVSGSSGTVGKVLADLVERGLISGKPGRNGGTSYALGDAE